MTYLFCRCEDDSYGQNHFCTQGERSISYTVICNGIKVVENHKLILVDEEEKRDYADKIGRELLTKASSRIPGLKADIE